jgi:hypothetical protein
MQRRLGNLVRVKNRLGTTYGGLGYVWVQRGVVGECFLAFWGDWRRLVFVGRVSRWRSVPLWMGQRWEVRIALLGHGWSRRLWGLATSFLLVLVGVYYVECMDHARDLSEKGM